MRPSVGQALLRLSGGLCALAGFLAWVAVAWTAITELDDLTPQSDVGGRLMLLGVTGTILMVVGLGLLQVAAILATQGRRDEPESTP